MNSHVEFWVGLATVATVFAVLLAFEVLELRDQIDALTNGCGL